MKDIPSFWSDYSLSFAIIILPFFAHSNKYNIEHLNRAVVC